ncbi:MAG: transglutaminase family protein [Deltaproteobacteria bacterium]|nr:transglutaminase family protein [Deltaproteobacteria bacterium]NND29775.1 transglutaminase family protein [Myxococcales bacterium]MBT8465551.1 transglutaminase family protein [Deltaproteobacteria bacterium]MBT8480623.1 transglutaminase family protein [Deltaproteobacteria bacterium]NNK07040.1 transglutaminase family protein [Myxococcales bacterium]
MLIRTGYDIVLEYAASTPVLAMLYYHPSREASVRHREGLGIDPRVRIEDYTDSFGNRCARLIAGAGQIRFRNEGLVEDSGEPDRQEPDAKQHEIYALPDEALSFLLSSRYCEVDRMLDVAWQLFSDTRPGWARVQAVCDFVHQHLRFDYLEARSTRTAYEAYQERVGVCRDFTHLAVTLCRCLNIPARYCTGYLGEIGVPATDEPMDFSAWFDAYLGGAWHTFDARNNTPRVGRILMARGRDAADVALLTSFGPSRLVQFTVRTEEVPEETPKGRALR